jgi:hypothetical protein
MVEFFKCYGLYEFPDLFRKWEEEKNKELVEKYEKDLAEYNERKKKYQVDNPTIDFDEVEFEPSLEKVNVIQIEYPYSYTILRHELSYDSTLKNDFLITVIYKIY